jgi:hypothetical protein
MRRFQIAFEIEPGPHIVTVEAKNLHFAAEAVPCGVLEWDPTLLCNVRMEQEYWPKIRVVSAHEISGTEPLEQKTGAGKGESK